MTRIHGSGVKSQGSMGQVSIMSKVRIAAAFVGSDGASSCVSPCLLGLDKCQAEADHLPGAHSWLQAQD